MTLKEGFPRIQAEGTSCHGKQAHLVDTQDVTLLTCVTAHRHHLHHLALEKMLSTQTSYMTCGCAFLRPRGALCTAGPLTLILSSDSASKNSYRMSSQLPGALYEGKDLRARSPFPRDGWPKGQIVEEVDVKPTAVEKQPPSEKATYLRQELSQQDL